MDSFVALLHILSASTFCDSYSCDVIKFSFSICIGERGFLNFILSSINQGVADMLSAVLRVSLSLGDMFKLLLSNSGFMSLLPFSVFQGDTEFEIFFSYKNSPFTSAPPPSVSINWVRVKVTEKSASVNGCI